MLNFFIVIKCYVNNNNTDMYDTIVYFVIIKNKI